MVRQASGEGLPPPLESTAPRGALHGHERVPTAFDTPGYVKVAFNIRVEPYGSGRALITTETRTAATDPASLRRFARYWLVVGPFSALNRQLALRVMKSDTERRPGRTSGTRPPDA